MLLGLGRISGSWILSDRIMTFAGYPVSGKSARYPEPGYFARLSVQHFKIYHFPQLCFTLKFHLKRQHRNKKIHKLIHWHFYISFLGKIIDIWQDIRYPTTTGNLDLAILLLARLSGIRPKIHIQPNPNIWCMCVELATRPFKFGLAQPSAN